MVKNIIGYRIFFRYLDYIWNSEEHDWLAALLGGMSLLADGSPADLAYESNWNNVVEKISDPNDTYQVYKPYLVTTKKEIREALGIPERTLDKLLKVLKANQEIFFKIKPGRNGGIQLASVKSLLLSIIKVKKEEKESYIKALSEFFDLEHTFIQETLNKLAERPKTDTQLDLFSYDTG